MEAFLSFSQAQEVLLVSWVVMLVFEPLLLGLLPDGLDEANGVIWMVALANEVESRIRALLGFLSIATMLLQSCQLGEAIDKVDVPVDLWHLDLVLVLILDQLLQWIGLVLWRKVPWHFLIRVVFGRHARHVQIALEPHGELDVRLV